MKEALIEMNLAGVSVRRVEDITEALWGSKVLASGDTNHMGVFRLDPNMAFLFRQLLAGDARREYIIKALI